MFRPLMIGVLAAVLGASLGGAAQAADLGAFYGQPEEPDVLPPPDYTFGTGWYLRGDLTATDEIKHKVGQLVDRGEKNDWNYGIGGGVGYQFTSYLRGDVTADYFGQQRNTYADLSGNAFRTTLDRYDVLANAYFDLGSWGGFTPYVGAGVGFAGLRDNVTVIDGLTGDSAKLAGRSRYNLAWAAMAGVAYHVSPNLLIDVGYRYLNLGDVTPVIGAGSRTLDSHQVRAGVRYMIY